MKLYLNVHFAVAIICGFFRLILKKRNLVKALMTSQMRIFIAIVE